MQVKVIDNLAAFAADVEDQFVARKSCFASKVFRAIYQGGKNIFVVSLKMGDRLDVTLRHDQYMHRRRWLYVLKSDKRVIFENKFRGNFFIGDLAENAGHKKQVFGYWFLPNRNSQL